MKIMSMGCCGLFLATACEAVAGTVWCEDFTNYKDSVPGMISDAGLSLGNNPIRDRQATLEVNLEKSASLYLKPIALPTGDCDILLDFALTETNSLFDVELLGGGKAKRVRVSRTGLADVPRTIGGGKRWKSLALRLSGDVVAVHFADFRKYEKICDLALGFRPEAFNFAATAKRPFNLSGLKVNVAMPLPDHSALRQFPARQSLEQPIAGGKRAPKDGATVSFAAAPRGGCRLTFGSTNAVATLKVDCGKAGRVSRQIRIGRADWPVVAWELWLKRKSAVSMDDALFTVEGLPPLHVRPKAKLYQSLWTIEPTGIDILRDWRELPSASAHPLDVTVVVADNDVQLWLDGSLHGTLLSAKQPMVSADVSLQLSEGIAYAVRDVPAASDNRFEILDFAARPSARAFADATLDGVRPGRQELDGYPMSVAAPIDSADIALCHQAMGNWALEVDEYHGRSPADGLPGAVHYRLPAAPYVAAGILFALDDDPAKDAVLTLRLGKYVRNGSGANMSTATTIDFRGDRKPANCREVGRIRRAGKSYSLRFLEVALDLGPILDLVSDPKGWLDFDVSGKPWENFQQLDNSMKPDPASDSAFTLFGCTLRKADFTFVPVETTPGNVFTADEKDRRLNLRVTALADGATGSLRWTATDTDGREAFAGTDAFNLAKRGDTKEIAVDLGTETPVGYYRLRIEGLDGRQQGLFAHEAAFAILPESGRLVDKYASPYATWWFARHGSPGDPTIGGPLLKKAGIRKAGAIDLKKDTCEKYDITVAGNLTALRPSEFDFGKGVFKSRKTKSGETDGETRFVDHVKAQIARKPWCDHILLWHENAPSAGIPEELLDLSVPPLTDEQKKAVAYFREVSRIVRKHFPKLRIQIGNSFASMGAAAVPLRAGVSPDSFDTIGVEASSQVIVPERRIECGLLGMLASQDVASRLAGRKVALDGCWEFTYRCERDMGEAIQARWYVRDALISLAHGFHLVSPGLLFDCSNGYYNGLWGQSGILRRAPYVYPKPAYAAYAVLTKALDGVTFAKAYETGSSTVYALGFTRVDGRAAAALWCARGEAELELDQDVGLFGTRNTLVTMYGRAEKLSWGKTTVRAGEEPIYVVGEKPLCGVRIVGRAFATDAALAARAKTAAPLASADEVTVASDPDLVSTHHRFFPVFVAGSGRVASVTDEEKGACVELKLDTAKKPDLSPYYTEFVTLRLKEPKTLDETAELIGVWVKGNSNWGQIRFEIEDADGEVFKNISTGRSWGCDMNDWPGNLAVNFDGWNFVYTTLRETKLVPTHSPGPYDEQWMSTGGDKKIRFPVRVRAVSVGMNRRETSLFGFHEKPNACTLRLKDIGSVSPSGSRPSASAECRATIEKARTTTYADVPVYDSPCLLAEMNHVVGQRSAVRAGNVTVDVALPGGNAVFERFDGDTIVFRQDLRDNRLPWFYWAFRVRGAAGRTLSFACTGARPLTNRGAAYSLDRGKTWRWTHDREPADPMRLTFTFPDGADEVWFSQTIPYAVSDWERFLRRQAGKPIREETLAKTRLGNDVRSLLAGKLEQPRYRVLLTSRHHAQECTGTWVMEGVLEAALADDALGRWFRDNVCIRAIPFVDTDGVLRGDQGKSRAPHDHNRDYSLFGEEIYPEIRAVEAVSTAERPDVLMDLHSPCIGGPNRWETSFYQIGASDPVQWGWQREFAGLLAKGASGLYRVGNDIAPGQDWNCAALTERKDPRTATGWWRATLPESFATCFELPFANDGERTLGPDDWKAFGRDLAAAIRAWLESTDSK